MTRKNAEQRTTGDQHQVPAHSTKGQKRTAKDRYKLPVGLLKRFTRTFFTGAFGFVEVQGNIPLDFFKNKCGNSCPDNSQEIFMPRNKSLPTKK
jgi:hypothetical protein